MNYKYILAPQKTLPVEKIGVKAQNLIRLQEIRQARVPNFFILSSQAYTDTLAILNNGKPVVFRKSDFHLPDAIKSEIKHLIGFELANKSLVVRSSAQVEDTPLLSFAGQYDSFLNICGFDKVVDAIRKCYNSLLSPNAKVYAKLHGLDLISYPMALIIQELAPITMSGVMFTRDPVFGSSDIVIEQVKGLGDQLTSGVVKPNLFRLKRKKQINSLFNSLVNLALEIEDIFGNPRDVEWGYNQYTKQFYLFQSRPITFREMNIRTKMTVGKRGQLLCRGETASRGLTTGRFVLIENVRQLSRVEKGDIVFVDSSAISQRMIVMLEKINGLVFSGGILSHFAVVMREFGKPCLGGVSKWSNLIRDYNGKKALLFAVKPLGYLYGL